jgi:putative SOS response-associated peptidase YedK
MFALAQILPTFKECADDIGEQQERKSLRGSTVFRSRNSRICASATTLRLVRMFWENWKNSETKKWIRTCTIITGEPNELVAQIHPRMPVIISEQHHAAWLGETDDGNVKKLLVPYPADQMRMWEISPRVNSPKNDDPSLWEPLRSEPAKTEAETFELVP